MRHYGMLSVYAKIRKHNIHSQVSADWSGCFVASYRVTMSSRKSFISAGMSYQCKHTVWELFFFWHVYFNWGVTYWQYGPFHLFHIITKYLILLLLADHFIVYYHQFIMKACFPAVFTTLLMSTNYLQQKTLRT